VKNVERLFTDEEICKSYKEAVNKTIQIGILCQLNQMQYKDIIDVLIRGGVMDNQTDVKRIKHKMPCREYRKWNYKDYLHISDQFKAGKTQRAIAFEYGTTYQNIQKVYERLKKRFGKQELKGRNT